jgi:hypothetical protein
MANSSARALCAAAVLILMGGCTEPQEREYDLGVDEPAPELDPTQTQHWEPMREGIQPPPEHRQPLDFGENDMAEAEARQQRRLESGDPRAEEGPPTTPTEQPLPVDAPIPEAVDDRPEGLDPTQEPLIDPVGDPEPPRGREPRG